MSEVFAKRLKKEREAKGWSQQHMAELLNLTNGTISGYERNYREPDFLTLLKITELLNVSAAYLIGETERKPRDAKSEHFIESRIIADQSDLSAEEAEAIALIRRSWPKLTPEQRHKRLDFLKNYTKLTDDIE